MTFQYTPEQFRDAKRSWQRTSERPAPDRGSASEHASRKVPKQGPSTTQTMMVQTPMGAAMMVTVHRRTEATQVASPVKEVPVDQAPTPITECTVKPSHRRNGMPLPHSVSCHVRVAAAPDR